MEFLNKPMAEVWKSTKQTFSELSDTIIGLGSSDTHQRQPAGNDTGDRGRDLGAGNEQTRKGLGPASPLGGKTNEEDTNVHLSRDKKASMTIEKPLEIHSTSTSTSSSSSSSLSSKAKANTKRPLSEHSEEFHRTCINDTNLDSLSNTAVVSPAQHQRENNTRHSLGKLWKDLKTLNINSNTGMTGGTNKLESPTTKKSAFGQSHSKRKAVPSNNTEMKNLLTTSNVGQENEKLLRTHRTHSHSRSRQGSISDSQHFRSSSTDRASAIKYKQTMEKDRPFLRSASDDSMLCAEQVGLMQRDDDDDLSADKMKTKILSMWNNVRYGWTVKTRTAFSLSKPIWILGKNFQHKVEEIEERLPGQETVKSLAVERFKREFSSRIWLTYRREFPQLAGSNYTTDTGWGCMLRSGQMMLAQALVQHFLGKEWNYYSEQTMEEMRYHREIVRWFGDQPDDMSPFSLHQLVEIGKGSGKKAGDWYGPASVAHIFKEAVDQAGELNPLLEQICIYVAQDCTIYKQDVINLCKRKRSTSLQPIYGDHGTPPTSSPVTPPPSSTYSTSHKPPSHQGNAAFKLSAESRHASNPSALNRTSENLHACSSPQNDIIDQSLRQADNVTNGETNAEVTSTVHPQLTSPVCNYPEFTDRSEESSTMQLGKLSGTHPPAVVAKPKTLNVDPEKNGNSPKQSAAGQLADDTERHRLKDSAHQTDEPRLLRSPPKTKNEPGTDQDTGSRWCAVVILVPVRLGGDEVNPIYIASVQSLFTLDFCIGIIGGKPKHSLYYVGFQEEKLIHLDPHYCQPVVDMKTRDFSLSSFHCMSPRKMAISKMDPSCTVGFYLRTEQDFHKFCETISKIVQGPSTGTGSTDYPMFILREGTCQIWNGQHLADKIADKPERYLRVRHVNENGELIAPIRESEDFVFLDS